MCIVFVLLFRASAGDVFLLVVTLRALFFRNPTQWCALYVVLLFRASAGYVSLRAVTLRALGYFYYSRPGALYALFPFRALAYNVVCIITLRFIRISVPRVSGLCVSRTITFRAFTHGGAVSFKRFSKPFNFLLLFFPCFEVLNVSLCSYVLFTLNFLSRLFISLFHFSGIYYSSLSVGEGRWYPSLTPGGPR